ncbi:MAG: hypothetical protein A2W90_09265 [Bacteroidetes bacterium GWF2_42_66]|nr:MAG: hypothetical protein A2W92_12240 [Bacteroidetes bacterium GWA2_42_15]OFY00594.1 MAG: hypothetical protein A2W89_20580 [Bacteroidetes bacterium GWE2_42_39]OFY42328.1 MAG: hypothetical protein A2W90_09265 [Bacteroidetes bacterium GWF2_42_66]HBL76484.1 hypothetical protein [Prolixibacteraceae bacterium]HCU63123.1 hypothetical protein [Prolixibacteraceae bacterium]
MSGVFLIKLLVNIFLLISKNLTSSPSETAKMHPHFGCFCPKSQNVKYPKKGSSCTHDVISSEKQGVS